MGIPDCEYSTNNWILSLQIRTIINKINNNHHRLVIAMRSSLMTDLVKIWIIIKAQAMMNGKMIKLRINVYQK